MCHPFEEAGLGKAPFKVVGFSNKSDRAELNNWAKNNGLIYTTNLSGGTCDYCGTAIMNVFQIQSSDGNQFKVGCDCVLKVNASDLHTTVKRIKKQMDMANKLAKAAETLKLMEDNKELLSSKPHPNAYLTSKGKTLYSYFEYVYSCSGVTGRINLKYQVSKKIQELTSVNH